MEVLSVNSSSVEFASATSKTTVWEDLDDYQIISDDNGRSSVVGELAHRLEDELRIAKKENLWCGEVLLPCDLLERIAAGVLASADTEPCGVRGCTLYLTFESDDECRRLGVVKFDPTMASTFELYLTLKQSTAGWNSFLPQFLKKITGGGTIMISPDYELRKKKLYRSYVE